MERSKKYYPITRGNGTLYLSRDADVNNFVSNKLVNVFFNGKSMPLWARLTADVTTRPGDQLLSCVMPKGEDYAILTTRQPVPGQEKPRKLCVLIDINNMDIYTTSLVVDSEYFEDSLFYAVMSDSPSTLTIADAYWYCGRPCDNEPMERRQLYSGLFSLSLSFDNALKKPNKSPFTFNVALWNQFLHVPFLAPDQRLYVASDRTFALKAKYFLNV
jgi:hypothetical protein